ncbi:hypothetical protein NM208_g2923 [Fusarium decemcellulare]|uniref:Uncharacterized protein n=1 Tax=Fusarium decemcellulare TaxID=57161 RepID=A0ACC1SR64_9HYPO|nr:hypothetical protein NM208_g2923 [Fusarium decemcellulare]
MLALVLYTVLLMAKTQQPYTSKEETSNFSDEERFVSDFSEAKKKKKVLRKMGLHIIPCLISLYVMSYIDRANIGNAKIEGMNEDLGLTGNQYNVVLSIFFVTYIIFGQ